MVIRKVQIFITPFVFIFPMNCEKASNRKRDLVQLQMNIREKYTENALTFFGHR